MKMYLISDNIDTQTGFFCLQKSSAENSRKLWMR